MRPSLLQPLIKYRAFFHQASWRPFEKERCVLQQKCVRSFSSQRIRLSGQSFFRPFSSSLGVTRQSREERGPNAVPAAIKLSEEVRAGLSSRGSSDAAPSVALETAIYTHGFPYPDNVALASHLESIVRLNGGIPATIGILNGVPHIGFESAELNELCNSAGRSNTMKVSTRDLPYIYGSVSAFELFSRFFDKWI